MKLGAKRASEWPGNAKSFATGEKGRFGKGERSDLICAIFIVIFREIFGEYFV